MNLTGELLTQALIKWLERLSIEFEVIQAGNENYISIFDASAVPSLGDVIIKLPTGRLLILEKEQILNSSLATIIRSVTVTSKPEYIGVLNSEANFLEFHAIDEDSTVEYLDLITIELEEETAIKMGVYEIDFSSRVSSSPSLRNISGKRHIEEPSDNLSKRADWFNKREGRD